VLSPLLEASAELALKTSPNLEDVSDVSSIVP
jgi:hypothetical protein